MIAFARVVGSFLAMMAIGYLAVVLLLPAPNSTFAKSDDVITGRSAAVRLSDEAQALVGRKPVEAAR